MDARSRTDAERSAWAATALSAGLAGIAVADQVTLGWTHHDVTAHYGAFGLNPAPEVLTSFLAAASLGAAATFAGTALLTRHGRRKSAIATAGLALVLGVAVACLTTFAFEYDDHVFTTFWRFAPWVLPLAAGAVCALIASRSR